MIVEPINDTECLGQLTTIIRELASTTFVRLVAQHLGTREAVIEWIQAKPQADDDGRETVQFISCDVPQRVRLFADDPNCVERAVDTALLLEALEQLNRESLSRRTRVSTVRRAADPSTRRASRPARRRPSAPLPQRASGSVK